MDATTDVFNATLTDRQNINDELCIVRISPDSEQVPLFEPGQFITLGLPKDPTDVPANAPSRGDTDKPQRPRLVRRAFSIASSALVRDHIELYLVLVKEGRFTPMLWALRTPGGRVWMDNQAKGTFTLEGVPEGKDLVMVATGTGLAPFMSMLRTYRGTGMWRRYVIIHGVRLASDLGYHQELEQISREDPSVIYLPTVTREPQGSSWTGLRGRVQSVLAPDTYLPHVGAPLDPRDCHVFLCGNPEMITSAEETLMGRGFLLQTKDRPGNLHFERYW